jgi:hypothetical protein
MEDTTAERRCAHGSESAHKEGVMGIHITPTPTSWVIDSTGGGSLSYGLGVKFSAGLGIIEFSLKNESTGAVVLYRGKGLGAGAALQFGNSLLSWDYSHREHFPTWPIGHIYDERCFRKHPLDWEDFEGFVLVTSGYARLQGKLPRGVAGGGNVAEMLFHRGPPVLPIFGPPTFKAAGFFLSAHVGGGTKFEIGVGVFSYYVAAVRFLTLPKPPEMWLGPLNK